MLNSMFVNYRTGFLGEKCNKCVKLCLSMKSWPRWPIKSNKNSTQKCFLATYKYVRYLKVWWTISLWSLWIWFFLGKMHKGAFIYDVRCFLGIFDLPNYGRYDFLISTWSWSPWFSIVNPDLQIKKTWPSNLDFLIFILQIKEIWSLHKKTWRF